ncbi:MAG: hypothetical protein LBQ73_09270 [Tannerellaceae bacterium]|jgi:hypothetical protein|nr:hypothetical protein [Tannerellaceae bacterium]
MKKVICVLSVLWLCVSLSNCSGISNPVKGKTFVIEDTDAALKELSSSSELGLLFNGSFNGIFDGLLEAFGLGSLSEIVSSIELEFQKEVFHFRSRFSNFVVPYQIRDNYIFVDEGGENAMTFKIINSNKIEMIDGGVVFTAK